jgi:hypothetical protein
MMSIVDESIRLIEQAGLSCSRRVVEVIPTKSFFVVVLDNGAHGWALTYEQHPERHFETVRLLPDQSGRALFRRHFIDKLPPLLSRAVHVALASALAVPIWRTPQAFHFHAEPWVPKALFCNAESAVVVGFGGLMFEFLSLPRIRALHIMDLSYSVRRNEMDAIISALSLAKPQVSLKVTDGKDCGCIKDADLVSITASALCNGTMEALLGRIIKSQIVVVQGHSGAIHPRVFFERGVSVVISSVKSDDMLSAAKEDRSGAALTRWVEGKTGKISIVSPYVRSGG